MPKVIVVASIGNRDITYRDASGKVRNPGIGRDARVLATELSLTDANLRAISQELLSRYKKGKIKADCVEFPILRPGLERVLSAVEQIDKLLMIVTDQQTLAFRKSDTVHCGELLAALIGAAFPGRVINAAPRFLVVGQDPQKPNVMYRLIREKLSELLRVHKDVAFHVLATGGTPAITDGLRHAAMNVLRDRSSVIQVDPPTAPTAAGTARVVDWEPYLEDVVRDGARALVEKGNFTGALEVLDAFCRRRWPPAALHLLKHADARVSLRVGRARSEAERAKLAMPVGSADLDAALAGVLVTGNPVSKIARVNEVRFLVELHLSQKRYADALVRIEQFRETARSVFSLGVLDTVDYTFLNYVSSGLPVGVVEACGLRVHGNPLETWLSRTGARPHGGFWTMRTDKEKQALFDFSSAVAIVPGALLADKRSSLVRLLHDTVFVDLAVARNHSIHTADGVSERSITAVVSLGDLQAHIEATANALFASFGADATTYPYESLKRAIVDILAP